MLLIVDDVQMGCGRTGGFFSFELAGISPDIVTLAKSISGYGLPLALTLIKPECDVWQPGEHNGTFRGNNPAFVTGSAALTEFWADDALEKATLAKGKTIGHALEEIADRTPETTITIEPRGRGLARGLAVEPPEMGEAICWAAFARGLLVETSGPNDEVVKLMPPLTATDSELEEG